MPFPGKLRRLIYRYKVQQHCGPVFQILRLLQYEALELFEEIYPWVGLELAILLYKVAALSLEQKEKPCELSVETPLEAPCRL